jgi:hypothetical protein
MLQKAENEPIMFHGFFCSSLAGSHFLCFAACLWQTTQKSTLNCYTFNIMPFASHHKVAKVGFLVKSIKTYTNF